ncbi:hypothetical protein AAE478_009686 [Parahypoxylon ruwenzoriense]
MGRRHKDGGPDEQRPPPHRHLKPQAGATPPHPHPGRAYSFGGTSYFPHPLAYHGRGADDRDGNPDGSHQGGRPGSPSVSGASAKSPRNRAVLVKTNTRQSTSTDAELKISLAAKHLADQIDESKKFWITFQKKFEKEVTGVRYYVSDDIMQKIWQERIKYNSKYKSGEDEDNEQFCFQRVKLETCLDQVNEAGKTLIRSQPLNDHSAHDPRRLALEKIRGTGSLVLDLAARSATNSTACKDLLTEASNLKKLVDPRGLDAKALHRFDRRETKKSKSRKCDPGSENADEAPSEPASTGAQDASDVEVAAEADAKDDEPPWL